MFDSHGGKMVGHVSEEMSVLKLKINENRDMARVTISRQLVLTNLEPTTELGKNSVREALADLLNLLDVLENNHQKLVAELEVATVKHVTSREYNPVVDLVEKFGAR